MAAGAGHEAETQVALDQLYRSYWPPLYSFVRRRGYAAADAQDLVQGFFVHLLTRRGYTSADPTKGKFRAFLLTSLKNFLSDEWTRDHREKRGGQIRFVLLEDELASVEAAYIRDPAACGTLNEERLFERRWAATLAANAMARLKEKYSTGPKARVFAALRPYLTGEASNLRGHEEIASSLGVPVDTLRSYLLRMRTSYRARLREEVARTVAQAEDVEEELRHLYRVLVEEGGSEMQPGSGNRS